MNAIKDMNLSECIDEMRLCQSEPDVIIELADRISHLTQWIPTSKKMPTENDADENGNVEWWMEVDGIPKALSYNLFILRFPPYWRRINPPTP